MMKQVVYSLSVLSMVSQLFAQTWPDIHLTNGTHYTSYGVEAYDPATAKNLFVESNSILRLSGNELGVIHNGNELYLNGGGIVTPVLDGNDFSWNEGKLYLSGGMHSGGYGVETGTGKILYIWEGAEVDLTSLNSISANNQVFLGSPDLGPFGQGRYGGLLQVGTFNASNLNIKEGGTFKVTETLTGLNPELANYGLFNLVLSGPNARWDAGGRIISTSLYEDTTIILQDGAQMISSGASFENNGLEIDVVGEGSKWVSTSTLALYGDLDCHLAIRDGGHVSATSLSISSAEGRNNYVEVDGNNSELDLSGGIRIGNIFDLGQRDFMSISGGGHVSSAGATLSGRDGAGSRVAGAGSRWDINGNLTLSSELGGNYLDISSGATVTCSGDTAAGSYVDISGPYSSYADGIYVSGTGTLFHCSGRISIGAEHNNLSKLNIGDGATVYAGNGVDIYENGSVALNSKINLNDGGRLEIGTDFNASMTGFNYNSGSELSVEGQLSGLSNLESGRRLETPDLLGDLTVHGIFAPGTSPADSIVDGALTIASDGTLEMELAGYALSSEYDRLTITGFSTLDGLLDIVSLGGFTATNGASFDLFNWDGGVSGTFSSISTTALSGGQYWDTSELYTTGQLSVIPEPGSIGLLGLGSGLLLFARRHRRRRGAGGTPAVHSAKPVPCDLFDPPTEVIAMHRRDFWDMLIVFDHVKLRVKALAKSKALHCLDGFLSLILK